MNKKTKILISIIGILIIVLITVGIISFSKYKKEENKPSTYNNSISSDDVEGAEGMNNDYSSKEEVLQAIQSSIIEDGVTVSFVKEEDGCWYYEDTTNTEYMFCESNPTIIKMEKEN